jgi:hypothetical protein
MLSRIIADQQDVFTSVASLTRDRFQLAIAVMTSAGAAGRVIDLAPLAPPVERVRAQRAVVQRDRSDEDSSVLGWDAVSEGAVGTRDGAHDVQQSVLVDVVKLVQKDEGSDALDLRSLIGLQPLHLCDAFGIVPQFARSGSRIASPTFATGNISEVCFGGGSILDAFRAAA